LPALHQQGAPPAVKPPAVRVNKVNLFYSWRTLFQWLSFSLGENPSEPLFSALRRIRRGEGKEGQVEIFTNSHTRALQKNSLFYFARLPHKSRPLLSEDYI